MPFPQSFLDELMARSDIVDVVGSYVQLTRKGANLFGLCPFHSEKTGSFSVSPDKQIYYCFGCKRGGGAQDGHLLFLPLQLGWSCLEAPDADVREALPPSFNRLCTPSIIRR